MYVWQIKIVQWINDVEIDVNIVDFKHVLLLAWTKKVKQNKSTHIHISCFLDLVVRTDALKGRRGRLPSKPKSPSSRQPNSFQTQFCRFYNDSTPNPASLDFSKLNVKAKKKKIVFLKFSILNLVSNSGK
jgi:hypothetical protein